MRFKCNAMRFVGYAMRIEIKGLMVSVVLPTIYMQKLTIPKILLLNSLPLLRSYRNKVVCLWTGNVRTESVIGNES